MKNKIRKIVKEAIDNNTRVDKYGNPIPKNGQGHGPDPDNPKMRNRQGYEADGTKGPWFSRSVACATCVLLHDTDTEKWYVLVGKRGNGAPDYRGYWSLPCGYLDYNEDDADCAVREVYEETGIKIDKSQLKYFGKSASPYENKQNVCLYFVAILTASKSNLPFSYENMEEEEVAGTQWLPIEKRHSLMWAFDHDELLEKIIKKYSHVINSETYDGDDKFKIEKVIDILKSEGDIEYAIQILKTLL